MSDPGTGPSSDQGQREAAAAAAAATIPSPKASRFRIPRPQQHWTARYIKDRLLQAIWERRNPDAPWLTADAVAFLETWLKAGDVVAEFGSGRSTVFFAKLVGSGGRVASVEHHTEWYEEVSRRLAKSGAKHVRYINPVQEEAAYVAAAEAGLEGAAPDFALIDGLYRDACAVWAMRAVKPGGIVAVDNVQWYLPHQTFAPHAVGVGGKPASPKWEEFWSVAGQWRKLWTTNGVNDTAFFFKPGKA